MDILGRILDWSETAEIETCGNMRGNNPDARLMIFMRLAAMAINGQRFGNATQFERAIRRSSHAVKQARTVWDACIRLGILTDDGRGFSLAKWLESKTRENLPSEGPVSVEATKYTTEPQKTRQEEKQAAKNGIDAVAGMSEIPDALPNGRFQVRDNISLTGPELSGIRAVHGADTERVLDEVSAWLRNRGARPRNIAGVIEGWGKPNGSGAGKRKREAFDPFASADLTLMGYEAAR